MRFKLHASIIPFAITFILLLNVLVVFTNVTAKAETGGSPSEALLGAGAKWAANGGTRALFVDSYDNWVIHGNTDGVGWVWWGIDTMAKEKWSIYNALSQAGLCVTFAGDIPQNLSGYNVVVIASYFACVPRDSAVIRNYIAGGGGVTLLAGVPEYLRCYIKGTGGYGIPTDPLSVNNSEWLGFTGYENTGGLATLVIDHPFGTDYIFGDEMSNGSGRSAAAVTGANGTVIAMWQSGQVFACSHQFGLGRLYYQAGLNESLSGLDAPRSLTATPKDGSIVLTWNAPSNNGGNAVDYYLIYLNGTEIKQAVGNSMIITGLTNGQSYTFAIAAHNSTGISPQSKSVSSTPIDAPIGADNSNDMGTVLIVIIVAAIVMAFILMAMTIRGRRT